MECTLPTAKGLQMLCSNSFVRGQDHVEAAQQICAPLSLGAVVYNESYCTGFQMPGKSQQLLQGKDGMLEITILFDLATR